MKKIIFPAIVIFGIFAVFCFADNANAAIAFDKMTSSSAHAAQMTFAHTVSGDNRILFYFEVGHDHMPLSSVTWNGDALTSIANYDSGQGTYSRLWYLLNPDDGTHNLVATSADSDHWHDGAAISYTGVLQENAINATSTSPLNVSTGSYDGYITTTIDNAWIIWGFNYGSYAPTAGTNAYKRVAFMGSNGNGLFDTNSAQTPIGGKGLNVTSANQQYTQGVLAAFLPYIEQVTETSTTSTASTGAIDARDMKILIALLFIGVAATVANYLRGVFYMRKKDKHYDY